MAAAVTCAQGICDETDLRDPLARLGCVMGRVEFVAAKPVPDIAAAILLIRPDSYIAYAQGDDKNPGSLSAPLSRGFGSRS